MKKKVILDCDPGSDDAVAIMLAWFSDDIDLMAITTVNGNRIVPKTTENALRMVQFLHADVPVYRGCENPIICNEIPSRKPNLPRVTLNDCHGDFLPLPEAKIKPQPEHAVFYLVKTLMESDGDIYVAATAPLTNIAMALRIEPRIAGKIKQLVIMGGAICGAVCRIQLLRRPRSRQNRHGHGHSQSNPAPRRHLARLHHGRTVQGAHRPGHAGSQIRGHHVPEAH